MSLLAQAVDPAAPTNGLAELLSVGGPISGVLAAVAFLGKMWLDARKEKREDKASDRQSETGIVETTTAALKMVRNEMEAMSRDIATLRQQVKDRDLEIEKLQDTVRSQAGEIEVLRFQLNKRGQESES